MKNIGLVVTGWLALLAPNFAAASIQITSNILLSEASDGAFTDSTSSSDVTFPPGSSVDAIAGDPLGTQSFANMGVNWSFASGQTILDFGLNHHRSGVLPSLASSKATFVQFTALDNEPYKIAGFYNVTNLGPDQSGASRFNVLLFDITTGTNLSLTRNASNVTSNAEYEVGVASGDSLAFVEGSLTGNLVAGNDYFFAFEAAIETNNRADAGANGFGQITLTIGANAAVPEPTSFFVWGGLAAVIGAAVCRRAQR